MNLKENKRKLLLSSLVILLPIAVGLLLWNRLPDTLASHWGVDNQVDGWSSKAFAVFAHPLFLLLTHWLCIWITSIDPRNQKQSKKAFDLIFWIIPIISLFSSSIMFGTALGSEISTGSFVFGMVGLMFLCFGNYMPKIKQNHTLGIKVIWTLQNEENWNATHRFTGKVWVVCGLAVVLLVFFPMDLTFGILFLLVLAAGFLPLLYSYLYYKKQCKSGRGYVITKTPMDKTTRIIYRCSLVFVTVILLFVCIMVFTGDITYIYGEDKLTIDTNLWNDMSVAYDAIDSMEYRSEAVTGSREYGFGSPRLLMGSFKNEEFGMYTRYTYTQSEDCIVLTVGSKTLIIAGETPEDTQAIFRELLERTNKNK